MMIVIKFVQFRTVDKEENNNGLDETQTQINFIVFGVLKRPSDSFVCHVNVHLGHDPVKIDLLTQTKFPLEIEVAFHICLFVSFYCEIKTKKEESILKDKRICWCFSNSFEIKPFSPSICKYTII